MSVRSDCAPDFLRTECTQQVRPVTLTVLFVSQQLTSTLEQKLCGTIETVGRVADCECLALYNVVCEAGSKQTAENLQKKNFV